jgi:hypothetical protein
MKTLRLLFILTALLLISFPGFTQGLSGNGNGNARGAGWLSGQLPYNARFNLEVGTSFSSFSPGTSMYGNYIAPRLEYDLSPSFTVIAGGSFSFNQYNNLPQSLVVTNNSALIRQGLTDHSLYLSGRYMFNQNLFMTGTVYSDKLHLPMLMNPGVLDYSIQGMTMGIGYRINNNISFGAEIGVNRTNNPFQLYTPFSDPMNNRWTRQSLSPF